MPEKKDLIGIENAHDQSAETENHHGWQDYTQQLNG
jgi:hypothetical protein